MPSYYIRPVTHTYTPTALVSWVTRVRSMPSASRCDRVHETAETIAVAASRFRRGRWSIPCRESFLAVDEAHDWLERWANPRQRTYVIAPCAGEALTTSDWWNRITERGAVWEGKEGADNESAPRTVPVAEYSLQTLILRNNPDVVRYSVAGRGICWLSGHQYFDMSEGAISRAVSYVRPGLHADDAVADPSQWAPEDRADLWLRAMQQLCDWWRLVHGGPWGVTTGALALNFFRSRLAPKTILNHDDQYARKIEAHAVYGGRASVFYMGDIGAVPDVAPRKQFDFLSTPRPQQPGPATLYDVRSMYPFLLGDRPFPTKYIGTHERCSVERLGDLLKERCVIAVVDLETDIAEYPYRHQQHVIYPVGTFSTTLCGPELEFALEMGHVRAVRCALTYHMGRPFTKMADDVLGYRVLARKSDNPAWELFVKSFSNAFSGKMNQRKGAWERRPDMITEEAWTTWARRNVDTGKSQRFRAIAKCVQEYEVSETEGRVMGASYAYLTAYGRSMMREARASLPSRAVVSQDTDGLWVLTAGVESDVARALQVADSPGRFSRKKSVDWARFYSPKHYVADGLWTLAGYHDCKVSDDWTKIEDSRTLNPILGSFQAPPAFVCKVHRSTPMVDITARLAAGAGGWTVAPAVRSGRLVASTIPSDIPSLTSHTV